MTWWSDRRGPQDGVVDELIAHNAARPRPGMEKPDLAILARIGQARWDETRRAQERQPHDARPT